MKDLFNRTFFRFTMGFVGILILSFAFAAVVSNMETQNEMPASATTGR